MSDNRSNPFKIFGSKTVYENRWIRVREDKVVKSSRPDVEGIYSVVETNDSVMIGAINNENKIFLIYSFSYPAQSWQWELPGGGGDGENVIVAAQRELVEETGITAKSWKVVGDTRVCDGLMTERMKTFIATDLTVGEPSESDDRDLIADGKFFSFDEVHQMVNEGLIDEGQSITALYLIESTLNRLDS